MSKFNDLEKLLKGVLVKEDLECKNEIKYVGGSFCRVNDYDCALSNETKLLLFDKYHRRAYGIKDDRVLINIGCDLYELRKKAINEFDENGFYTPEYLRSIMKNEHKPKSK